VINETLVFLKNSLNALLNAGANSPVPQEDQVVFPVGGAIESINLKLGAISIVLINIEQDNVLRAPDLYRRTGADGRLQEVQPEIRLNLLVLLVAHYQKYEDSLRNLSTVIQYFQNHRLITQRDSPALNENIEQLVVELVTLSFSEQNEVWGALRLPYHPSALYKVKMVVFQAEPALGGTAVEEITTRVSQ
jgi:hypothetical protein